MQKIEEQANQFIMVKKRLIGPGYSVQGRPGMVCSPGIRQ